MLSIVRKIFLEETLKSAENYSKDAYCWYHIPIESISFKDGNETMKAVNKWANTASVDAVKNISPTKKDKKLIRHNVAGDPELLQKDRVVIASSIFLQVHWKNELFKSEDTIKDGEFELENSKV